MKKRFDDLHSYYSDLPRGWALYSDKETEEKVFYAPFLYASKHFEKKFSAGDEQAIFTFVKKFPESFREVWAFSDGTTHPCYSNNNIFLREHGRSWVVEQIEKWRAEGTPKTSAKLKKLLKTYADARGQKKKSPDDDWKIYYRIKQHIKNGSNVTKAIWAVACEDAPKSIDHKLKVILDKHQEVFNNDNNNIKALHKKLKIPWRKSKAYIDAGSPLFNTYREIYYKLDAFEESENRKITEKNLRFQYFLPTENLKIPKKYESQFKNELSLFCNVEWLRQGFISFPQIRSGLSIPSGVRPFNEERLSLKEALLQVSKEENILLNQLREIYTNLKKIQAAYFNHDCLEVLKEL